MNFTTPRRRRRLTLTPLIDVVFLLLIFFMLLARFQTEGGIDLALGGGRDGYTGPPRVIDVTPATTFLNGQPHSLEVLPDALRPLVASGDDTVVLRARDGATTQRLVDVMTTLSQSGFSGLTVLPAP